MFTESVVEEPTLDWLESLGWTVKQCPEIVPGDLAAVVQVCLVRNSVDENRSQRYSSSQGNGV